MVKTPLGTAQGSLQVTHGQRGRERREGMMKPDSVESKECALSQEWLHIFMHAHEHYTHTHTHKHKEVVQTLGSKH